MRVSIPRYDASAVIGLPRDGRVITWANTERADLACPTRWWFRHVERLQTPGTFPLRLGTAWHAYLEEVHRWWMARDAPWVLGYELACPFCEATGRSLPENSPGLPFASKCPRCEGTGLGILVRLRSALLQAAAESAHKAGPDAAPWFTVEEAEETAVALVRLAEGWHHRYGREPYATLRVVAVEVAVARVVRGPTGAPFCPETFILTNDATGESRLAETGEAIAGAVPPGWTPSVVRWPWYQIGRLDSLLQQRKGTGLYVGEWKTSGDPRGLISDLSVDPQTTGYNWLLAQDAVRVRWGGAPVGYLYDVSSSHPQHDPEPLKGRPTKKEPNPPLAFSQARNRNTPSWRYMAALRAHGLDPAPYAEHLLYLAGKVDTKLYTREHDAIPAEDVERYGDEAYGIASRIAGLRRDVARARSSRDLAVAVPRVAICRLPGGSCPFRAPCLLDGDDSRGRFEVGPGHSWGGQR